MWLAKNLPNGNSILSLSDNNKFLELEVRKYLSGLEEFETKDFGIGRLYYVHKDKSNNIKLDVINGAILVFYDKINDKLLVILQDIADALNAFILINESTLYPIEKIRAAQKRFAKLEKQGTAIYQIESFGINNMWLTIKAPKVEVINHFNLIGQQYSWKKALELMHKNDGLFLFEYKKWTFVAGIKTEVLFGCPPSTESISEKCHVSKLLEWGKRFNELQFYQHYDRSTFFNAFYRIHAKKIVYGEYETESYNKTYGAKPDGIIKMPSNEAYNAAGVWSIDPDTLRFEPELKNAKPWIMNIKQNT